MSNGSVYEPSLEASEDLGLYFRKVLPEAMRQLVGLVEVRRTLGTKDRRQAALRFTEVAAMVAQEWGLCCKLRCLANFPYD